MLNTHQLTFIDRSVAVKPSRRAIGISIATVLCCSVSLTAAAESGEDEVEQAASLVAELSPDEGVPVLAGTLGDALGVTAGNIEMTVPVNPEGHLSMGISDADAVKTTLLIGLPEELDLLPPESASDGTIVYPAADEGASAVVQMLDNGSMRVHTIIGGADDPAQFTYSFGPGVKPVPGDDGTIELVTVVDDAVIGVGHLGQAWAADADGADVDTWYEIADQKVVQHVQAEQSTIFPVVADPLFTYGLGVYMNLTGAQWKSIAMVLTGASVGVVTAACLGAKLPAVWAKAVGAACTIIGVSTGITTFLNSIKQASRIKLTPTACYQMKLGSKGGFTRVSASTCK